MGNYLILGAGGFVGKTVSFELAKQHNLRAFDMYPIPEFEGIDGIEVITGDFTKMESFDELLKGMDGVIHFISTTVPSDDTSIIPREIEQNIIPSIRLLEDMVRCGVKRIIYASSAGTVYGETGKQINTTHSPLLPLCSYGMQKVMIESYIQFYGRRYGIDYSIVRMTNPYGFGQDTRKMQGIIPIFVNKNLEGDPIVVFGDGDNMRDYVYIQDVAEAFAKIIDYKGIETIFNIGYGKCYSINEIIQSIETTIGQKFADISHFPARFCDVKESYVDILTTQQELNWYPKRDLQEGLSLTINILKNRGKT